MSTDTGLQDITATEEDQRIALLAALAIVIHVAESVLPSPIPGIKPGLANIVTVAVLCRFGWRAAAWVGLLRVCAGSLLVGTFLSPTFLMSAAGAGAAIAALGAGRLLPGIGPVGFSILAGLAHMAAQFAVAYHLLIGHAALLGMLPLFMTAALAFGVFNGVVAAGMLNRL